MLLHFFYPDHRLKHYKAWLMVGFALLLAIIYLSLSSPGVIPMRGGIDKLSHAFAYYCLMFWWLQLFPNKLARFMLAVLFTLLSGGIEFMQSFHPLRYMDWWDFFANAMGVLAALFTGFTRLDQLLHRFEKAVWG